MAGFPPGLGLLGYAPSLPFIFFFKYLLVYLFGCVGSYLWYAGSLLSHADSPVVAQTLSS